MGATSEDEGSTGDALDIVLYLFVLGPAVEWCLKSPRVNRGRPGSWRGVSLAVLLLALVAAGKMAWESGTREPNHFETLGVRVDAGTAEIKRAYKTESLKYHPDKTDDPAAPAIFMRMQRAYETLKDPSSRDAYNRFGGKSGDDESGGMTGAAMFYAIWLVLGYLLTMGRASEDARTWAFSGLLALAVVEYQTRVLPHTTVHEKLELLHRLFPPFLHGSRMISQVVFRDIGVYNKMLVEQMHVKVDELGKLAYATQREIAKQGIARPSGVAAPLAAAADGFAKLGGEKAADAAASEAGTSAGAGSAAPALVRMPHGYFQL
ncbi:hypothetical protein EMIHUDRAFT_454919 [Emiliania huxleyi CCMP1516]|uniref:J domain-containing protein n=2 Tax=Emiliania huxleyi TaxID=2903 RepID=A0A0D3KN86_EMIH1|nr:hypothetical protein EMIHUDRAFT_454919 [Emiliania huxleyi CCMP1516]EOD37221.1 hypothetical protein EMIHUDRAFT_454919 [Emiliania huxleyi CCMP1516]|eukprot:XP_005789650.1 hypothetical protein EMIHUDRAFT_454919 [Emiliania huxleyi CCMP1516]